MLRTLSVFFNLIPSIFRSRRLLLLEVLALRQQLAVLKARHPQPRFALPDRLFWVVLRRLWPGWKQALVIVQPETVVRWHRAGFKLYWTWLSRKRKRTGRRPTTTELRELIFRMVAENPTWGSPRIHGELRMLGFDISERTVLRWMRKAPRDPEPARRWTAFLSNHHEAIAAMDFFTVPTLTFGMIYCFFVISHDRRRILHCNVTRHPTSGRLRDECLNTTWFRTLNDVRCTLATWREEYNCERPHSSLDYRTPNEFRKTLEGRGAMALSLR